MRGLGQARVAKAFTWTKLKRAHRASTSPQGIAYPAHVSSISSRLLFRAAEVGQLNMEDVRLTQADANCKASCVYDISHSKTDAEARGCRLRLVCTCPMAPDAGADKLLCAVCCTTDYAVKVHGDTGPWHTKEPFFKAKNGRISASLAAQLLQAARSCRPVRRVQSLPPG